MANTFRHAHSEPINPPGAEPVLTREQVWAGLQRKGDVVTRIVQFKANWGPSGKVTEVCTSYHPAQILFEMDSGDRVSNIVSAGPSGESTDMFLTYVFDLKNPKADTEANAKVAKGAVSGTIAKFRELAKAGQI
ncbi:hypothetical protein RB597_007120 [Gaeumannomyces tritici]